jgi:hypothetical protein
MNWKAKLKPFFGVLLLLTVAFLPVIVCSLSLLGYHHIKKVGDPLFVSLFPFHYTYLLFPASNSLFFLGPAGFPCAGSSFVMAIKRSFKINEIFSLWVDWVYCTAITWGRRLLWCVQLYG